MMTHPSFPPNLYSPLFPPSNVIAPSIYFSNSDGGWGVWGLDVALWGRGLWRGLQVGVAVTNHRTIMADTNRSSNSGPAQQWKLFVAALPPHPFHYYGCVREMERGIVNGQCVWGPWHPNLNCFFIFWSCICFPKNFRRHALSSPKCWTWIMLTSKANIILQVVPNTCNQIL